MRVSSLISYLFKIFDFFLYFYLKIFRRNDFFVFNNKKIFYFYSLYNHTFRNERAIEIPIIYEEIRKRNFPNFLEVGNVLNHYFKLSHDVVDKYEKGKNVQNLDIINYKTDRKYKLTVSISTIEHIGLDEEEVDKKKVLNAICLLKDLLDYDGELIITVPLGYNVFLDKLIISNKLEFQEIFYFKREENRNIWRQVLDIDYSKVEFVKSRFYFYAKYLALVYFKK